MNFNNKCLLVSMCLSLTMCSEDEQSCARIKTIIEGVNLQDFNFVYTEDTLREINSLIYSYKYQYFKDSIQISFTTTPVINPPMVKTTTAYYDNGRLMEIRSYHSYNVTTLDTLRITYNQTGQIEAFNDEPVEFDNAGNLISAMINGLKYEFEYDRKRNPFQDYLGFNVFSSGGVTIELNGFDLAFLLSPNNMVRYNMADLPYTYKMEIQYDGQMPTKYKWRKYDGSQLVELRVPIHKIEYACD